jgi:hypothetical protein
MIDRASPKSTVICRHDIVSRIHKGGDSFATTKVEDLLSINACLLSENGIRIYTAYDPGHAEVWALIKQYHEYADLRRVPLNTLIWMSLFSFMQMKRG